MKLDTKCIKAVLESIEAETSAYDSFTYIANERIPEKLKPFTHNEIVYHIQYCDTCGYLTGCSVCGNGAMIIVEDLTPAGHTYLKDIRNKGILLTCRMVWEEKKKEGIGALIRAFFKWLVDFICSPS